MKSFLITLIIASLGLTSWAIAQEERSIKVIEPGQTIIISALPPAVTLGASSDDPCGKYWGPKLENTPAANIVFKGLEVGKRYLLQLKYIGDQPLRYVTLKGSWCDQNLTANMVVGSLRAIDSTWQKSSDATVEPGFNPDYFKAYNTSWIEIVNFGKPDAAAAVSYGGDDFRKPFGQEGYSIGGGFEPQELFTKAEITDGVLPIKIFIDYSYTDQTPLNDIKFSLTALELEPEQATELPPIPTIRRGFSWRPLAILAVTALAVLAGFIYWRKKRRGQKVEQ